MEIKTDNNRGCTEHRSRWPKCWGEKARWEVFPEARTSIKANASTAVLVIQQHKDKKREPYFNKLDVIYRAFSAVSHSYWITESSLTVLCHMHSWFAIQVSSYTDWWSLIKTKIYRAQISDFIEPTVLSKDPPFLLINWNNTFWLWFMVGFFLFFFFF